MTLWAPAGDRPLKEFRDPEKFTRVVQACPLQAHWLDGRPITDVMANAGILDRYRRFVFDGKPVESGSPQSATPGPVPTRRQDWGSRLGLLHARRLRDVVRRSLEDPAAFALEWDAVTEAEVSPWYWNQLAVDRARLASMDALREGLEDAEPALLPQEFEAASRAMLHDADVLRGVIESLTGLALPQEVFARPGMWERSKLQPRTLSRSQVRREMSCCACSRDLTAAVVRYGAATGDRCRQWRRCADTTQGPDAALIAPSKSPRVELGRWATSSSLEKRSSPQLADVGQSVVIEAHDSDLKRLGIGD